MKLGIMQPYLFPYIGYFQLMKMSDTFVIHDDVQYIKGGWVNRNRILQNGKDIFLTLPIKNDSAYLNINERYFTDDFYNLKKKHLRILENAYRKAPYFIQAYSLIEDIFLVSETNVSQFIVQSLKKINTFIGIDTPFILSSELNKDDSTKGQERVLEICRTMGCSTYVNPIGGITLYNKVDFEKNGIDLFFLRSRKLEYSQFESKFIPFLSIIDVLMFNSKDSIFEMLNQYDLE